MEDFNSLGLPKPLLNAIEKLKFTKPTPIQAQSIPAALEGKDILGTAQTGTGKTAAFGIPLITKLLTNSRGSALVMTPTRELAVQVMKTLEDLLDKQGGIKSALLIGGESMPRQLQQLKCQPRLIVGTPGRINDHLARGSLMLRDVSFLVLDETDRMLDMGFSQQIDKIVKFLPQARQTLLFSATLPQDILKVAAQYLRDPVRVSVGAVATPVAAIKQETLHISDDEKYPNLLTQLEQREGSIIVFVKTKWGAEKMAARLCREKHSADALHGDLRQNQRQRVITGFRDSKFRVLVATDIAARGLDISHIKHVINYDLPQCPDDFIHRIGRTARAGAEGSTICFITPADKLKWNAINRLLNPSDRSQDMQGHHSEPRKGGGKGRPSRFQNRRRNGGGGNKFSGPRRQSAA